GHMTTGATRHATALRARQQHARAFADHLHRWFALDPRVRTLAAPDTLVCRCEDVAYAQLQSFADSRDAKLATRCGMGTCQGRICGTALAELGFARLMPQPGGLRPPLFPVRLASLADAFPEASGSDTSFP